MFCPSLFDLLPCDACAVVGIVSVTVAADNLKTIKASLTDKTEGLRTMSELVDKYSQIAGYIMIATAVSQFFSMLLMWWYDQLALAFP